MQLERLLQSQGFGSRKECRSLIHDGRVEVAGVIQDAPLAEFEPEGLTFKVDGADWRYRRQAYVLLHKPAGYECSRAPRDHPSVLSLLPAPLVARGVQPVGRLDEDTTGLLLLTDDGAFIHRLTSPRRKVVKVYEAVTKHRVDAEQRDKLLAGLVLRDAPEPVQAVSCEWAGDHLLRMGVTEGRYHQVKRMVAAAGNRVEALKRVRIGDLDLPPELAPGAWRWLEAAELERLEPPA